MEYENWELIYDRQTSPDWHRFNLVRYGEPWSGQRSFWLNFNGLRIARSAQIAYIIERYPNIHAWLRNRLAELASGNPTEYGPSAGNYWEITST